jgi:hypothetical protein
MCKDVVKKKSIFLSFLGIGIIVLSLTGCAAPEDVLRALTTTATTTATTTPTPLVPLTLPPVIVHPPPSITGHPVLHFSDLTWGPKTGWEGSSTKGAAVTIWGKNFGDTRNNNYVSVNGAKLLNDTDYSEWGVVGPPKNIQRITFWINSNAQDGVGEITVTINGSQSNSLPFNITNGAIYFISVNDGDNTNTGLKSTSQGGKNGPFKDLCMFNPGLDGVTKCHNPSGDEQYIAYIKSGIYTELDADSAFVALRGPYGSPTKQKALIGFPGETHVIDTRSATRGIVWVADYKPYGLNSYFTFSKLNGVGGTGAFNVIGDFVRVISNTMTDYREPTWSGVIFVSASKNTAIYGNLFKNCGYDSYKHNIYIKTQFNNISLDLHTLHTDIGWNEFADAYAGTDARGGVIFISKSSNSQVAQYETQNTQIHHNYFHGGNMDFIYHADNVAIGDTFVYNNIFSGGTSPLGAISITYGDKFHVYNNTFYKTGAVAKPMIWETGVNTRAIFSDNIWYASSGQQFFKLENFKGATFQSNNDLFYEETGTVALPSGTGVTLTNAMQANPLFVDPGNGNFNLAIGSPALKNGTSIITSIPTLNATLPSYPAGTVFNIGAYEYTPP